MTSDVSIITINALTRSFGGVCAVDGVDLDIGQGTIHSIVGPNGAGKTTLFNVISGFVRADSGSIVFDGVDIAGLAAHERVPLGLVRTFQNIRLFGSLTVRENVTVAQHARWSAESGRLFRRLLLTKRYRAEAGDLLELLGLEEYGDLLAADLAYGVQKRVELARAMASRPKVVLLDEPTAGMNDVESRRVMQEITNMRTAGTTIVLVEHDMEVVMGLSDVVTVLNFGRVIAHGAPHEVVADAAVQEAYLGG